LLSTRTTRRILRNVYEFEFVPRNPSDSIPNSGQVTILPHFAKIADTFPRLIGLNTAMGMSEMKKVTEEQVTALIAGLERREREALADRHLKIANPGSDTGTARILPLKRRARSGDVVSLEKGRTARLKRTVSGMFLYSTVRA